MMSEERLGRIAIRFSPLVAGELVTVVFEYTVGAAGLAEGGKLRVGLPHVGWAPPEVPQYYFWSEYARGKDRMYTSYDRVNTTVRMDTQKPAVPLLESEARFRKPWTFPPSWLRDYDRYWITTTIEEAPLDPGDKVVVTYGDPEHKPLTARVQGFPEQKLCFLAFVDLRADGQYEEVPPSPWMTSVRAGPASRIGVVTPAIVRPESLPQALVAYTDAVHAPPAAAPEVEALEVGVARESGDPRVVPIGERCDSTRLDGPELVQPRTSLEPIRLHVCDPQRGFGATSNPTLLRKQGAQLFFGDLHGQSQYHAWNPAEGVGISCGTPEECYRYARDIAGLDFCAITDTGSIAKEIWHQTVAVAQRMNAPGSFVTFQGSEVGDDLNGHRNLIFAAEDDEPGITATTPNVKGDSVEEIRTPQMHQRYAGREDVILIPHHTKIWADWDCHDPGLEPVMEIYSIWGSCEKTGTDLWVLRDMTGGAQEAWARGYRIGVIGGSDTHAGLPGRSFPRSDRDDFMPFKSGYAAVWAEELTRGSIFKALRARRCYATTGARIILEVFIGEHPMGSEVVWPDPGKPRRFEVSVWGTDGIDTVTVVKNNADIATFRPGSAQAQFVYEDKHRAENGDWYYVRVIQRDGNRAWSSPLWLDIG